ncbi:hypothetical protein LY78DRAFT_669475 [Colletotrichum sublineola]|nr:hypothetical protein LY78DRAFT_669475 [Colletotrichum sublineola]
MCQARLTYSTAESQPQQTASHFALRTSFPLMAFVCCLPHDAFRRLRSVGKRTDHNVRGRPADLLCVDHIPMEGLTATEQDTAIVPDHLIYKTQAAQSFHGNVFIHLGSADIGRHNSLRQRSYSFGASGRNNGMVISQPILLHLPESLINEVEFQNADIGL